MRGHIRDNRIGWIDEGRSLLARPANGDIMHRHVREESHQCPVTLGDSCKSWQARIISAELHDKREADQLVDALTKVEISCHTNAASKELHQKGQ